jgi:hypothetical protein
MWVGFLYIHTHTHHVQACIGKGTQGRTPQDTLEPWDTHHERINSPMFTEMPQLTAREVIQRDEMLIYKQTSASSVSMYARTSKQELSGELLPQQSIACDIVAPEDLSHMSLHAR